MECVKMQGLGNDFVVVDLRAGGALTDPAGWARWACSRRFGIGADGLILLGPAPDADLTMTIYNADGSQAEMCGNALRCVGRHAANRGLAAGSLTIATAKGRNTVTWQAPSSASSRIESFTAQVAAPALAAADVPMTADTERAIDYPLEVAGERLAVTAMSFGNPHCVTFVPNLDSFDFDAFGPALTHHEVFPAQANAEFVQVLDRGHVRMRVHERGVGETLACGSGSCAVAVAGTLTGRTDASVEVAQPGGTLRVEYDAAGGRCLMTGPAEEVFALDLDLTGPAPSPTGATASGEPVFLGPVAPSEVAALCGVRHAGKTANSAGSSDGIAAEGEASDRATR